jgi:hypothetical protein
MRKIFSLFAALCLIVFVAPLALAQSIVGNPTSPPFLLQIWGVVQPLVALFISIVGPVAVTWISLRLVALLKINDENAKKELERKIRDALHDSAANALKFALAKSGMPLAVAPAGAVISEAIEYVRSKNPDTAAEAGVSDNDLREIILSKVPDVLATIAAGKLAPAKPANTNGGR